MGNPVQSFKGGSIPATFDQAEKIHGNIQQLREPFLSHFLLAANAEYSLAKTLA